MAPPAPTPSPRDRTWPYLLAVAGWLLVGGGAAYLADDLTGPAATVLVGLWVVGLGLLLRPFLTTLVGPVLTYDALRVGRRPRLIWLRVGYALLLAVLLTWVYSTWMAMAQYRGGGQIRPKDLAQLAETYFAIYMVVQFILVCLLTPAAVAGAIAEEKERRTLEFLLATDLRDREILFGKLASRVGGLILFLLAGLPILTLMQFFGGIDPDLVLAGFTATIVVVLSLAALGIAASVLARKARDAIALTYLVAIIYVVGSVLVFALCEAPDLRWTTDVFGYTVSSQDVGYVAIVGNPFFMVPYVLETRGRGGPELLTALGHFTLFHGLLITLLVVWAGLRLRSVALRQTFGGAGPGILRRLVPGSAGRGRASGRPGRVRRPDVGDSPVLWKEVFVDVGLRLTGFGRVIVFGLVAISLVPVGFIFWYSIVVPDTWRDAGEWWSANRWEHFGEGMNVYLRMAGTIASTLVFLAVAVRGAGAVTGERDRHTLDVLLTTPLTAPSIVWGKWWGCLLGMRWAWAWILGLWVLTLGAGGVHPVMLPFALVSLGVYASGFAWIGLFCSLHCRTTLRATMLALVMSLTLGGGYFLFFVVCCVIPLTFATINPGRDLELGIDFLCGFSPPVNMAWLPIREFDEWEISMSDRDMPFFPFWALGLLAWSGLSAGLAQACLARFRRLANREATTSPRPAPPWAVPPPLPPRDPRTGPV